MLRRPVKTLLLIVLMLFSAWPASAAEKLVAAVLTSDLPRYKEAHYAFVKTLVQHGYDQNKVEIILQTPNPDPISWANSVRKLAAIGANIIITYGAPVTLAAMHETDEIPIVFADVYDPVATGVSRSMTTTGRNMCGVSSKVPLITLVKTMQEIKPVKNLGILYNAKEAGSLAQLKEIKRVAAQLGLSVIEANVSSPRTLDSALSFLLSRVDCIYVSESSVVNSGFSKIVQKANSRNIPVISQMPEAGEKGALVALEVSPSEQGRKAGEFAVEILHGKNVRRMHIATPKMVELVINLRAAKALDLNVPFQVLGAATKVLK